VLGQHPGDRRRDASSSRGRQHEVADFDDRPLPVEVVQRPAADDLAGLVVDGGEGEEPSGCRERR
jgi:hypothetical protein